MRMEYSSSPAIQRPASPCQSNSLSCRTAALSPFVCHVRPGGSGEHITSAAILLTGILGGQSSQTTEAPHQCCQIRAVPFTHRFELQSQSATGLHMPHHAIGSNLSLLDKKMKLGGCAYALHPGGLNEQPSDAQIHHTRHITVSITFPVDPHTFP